MKTTDLIPLILYQLAEGDKYGYEIVKQIEDASSGKISIKQPTLYTMLKKLKQGRFISSYWQDSEIGGKRHYYTLTENGKAQLETYPPFDELINNIINERNDIEEPATSVSKQEEDNNSFVQVESKQDIVVEEDNFNDITEIKPIKIDLTSNLTNFSAQEDVKTELEPENETNVSIVEPTIEDNSSSADIVSIFDAIEPSNNDFNVKSIKADADKSPIVVEQETSISSTSNDLFNQLEPNQVMVETISNQEEQSFTVNEYQTEKVKYLNYIDLTKDKTSVRRKKAITKRIQKMSLTCLTLLILFVSSILIAFKYSFGKLYYISSVIVVLTIVLYPILLLSNRFKIKLHYCSHPFKYSVSRDFFIKLSLFLTSIISIFAYNLTIVNNLASIFKLNNFSNFIAPIVFSSVFMIDFLFNYLLYKEYRK